MATKRRAPIGTLWRILAGGLGREPTTDIHSSDYEVMHRKQMRRFKGPPPERQTVLVHRQTFDELVVMAAPDKILIHVEAMGNRTYFVQLGEDKRMIWVKRDGTVELGEAYR
jgi:hypothetical protein